MQKKANNLSDQAVDSANCWDLAAISKIILIVAQFSVLIMTIRAFNILDEVINKILLLILCGFVIHAFLPMRFRLPFFTLLSLASILTVLGPVTGAWVIGCGLVLIGICHLPCSFSLRITVMLLAVALLAGIRLDWNLFPNVKQTLTPLTWLSDFSEPWSAAFWPIFGSMFMFRMMIYLHDLHYEKRRPTLWTSLSYFFMVPNVCFPLFPVVDYARFSQDYYNEDALLIYQRGVAWIFRGVTHLILYQFVYLYMTIDPIEVNGVADMLQFGLAAFLLYLQVSGQFHLIVGILLLFGFNLPETNHQYYLASSFNNHWRRINIYWKDFMMKVFYYPLYFRLRKLGNINAIVLSTLVVFFATWVLHMYQWFWVRGTVLLEWHDGLFWAILGVLVIINSLYEIKHGRDRSLGKQTRTVYDRTATVLSTLGTFLTMTLLWGMWSSDSLSQWIAMWETTGYAWIVIILLPPALFLSAWCCVRWAKKKRKASTKTTVTIDSNSVKAPLNFWRLASPSVLGIVLVFSLSQSVFNGILPSALANALQTIRFKLNDADLARRERGYYDDLVAVSRQNAGLRQVYNQRPKNWNRSPGAVIDTNDFMELIYKPNNEAMIRGEKVTINRWGMRDKDYTLMPPPHAYRIALLGASHVFGSGVKDNENFDAIIENRLNSEPARQTDTVYEILNFGRGGRTALHQILILEELVLDFQPDVVIYVTHPKDAKRVVNVLARQFSRGIEIPFPFVESVLQRAGVTKGMSRFAIERALMPYGDELLSWAYRRIVDICKEHKIKPVWVLLPMVYERLLYSDVVGDIAAAEKAGFESISLEYVYNDTVSDDLVIAPWDDHPNALGHQLIARYLFAAMQKKAIF